ncbi:helix-turn-helix transcriptional regulator [Bacillus rhizoplanae]|uniref:helix-turn-helix transcriptional regulator n=1 Tax=Bacillus rhizoplanae TaxID=2880966 RepID=UPI003D2374E2
MKDYTSGQRILKFLDILKELTDENHFITMKDIQERLQIQFNRNSIDMKTLRKDLATLKEFGFKIEEQTRPDKQKEYSLDTSFSSAELCILIDAVTSARFLTKKDTNDLIKKLKTLTSTHVGKKMTNALYVDQRIKTTNPHAKRWIESLHQAINEHVKIKFKYKRYNHKLEVVYGRNGDYYTVIPYALVWNHDYYYLIAKQHKDDTVFSHYRVDRMEDVQYTNEHFHRESFDIADYIKKTFHMYTGIVENIEVIFHNHLINVIVDTFGTNIDVTQVDSDHFKIKFQAAVNDGLFRWLLTWGSSAKVVAPTSLVTRMKEESEKFAHLYTS